MFPASTPLAEQRLSELPLEIELKLSLPPSQAQRFWKTTPISTLLSGRPSRRRLFSAYYDTPDFELQNHGVALRLRREGRRWVQTLKTEGKEPGALQRRVELQVNVADGVLDLEWLKRCRLAQFSGREFPTTALGIVFTTEFDRNVAVVEPAAGTNVEVCVDQGTIIAGRRRQAVCEIELELKKGELAPLFDLARQLATIPGVRIETDSKALRGYRIATQTRPTPVKAGTISLPAEPSIDSLFTMLAFECMAQLQRNEQGILRTRDIEYLHQARVALRRLRSVFGVFSAAIPTNHFSDQLDWLRDLGRRLGQARDWDVFTADFLPTASSRIKDNAAFAGVMKKAARLRSGARRRVDEALRSPDYPVQMLLLTQKLHEQKWGAQRSIEQRETASSPVTAFAASVLERAHRKVIKQGKHMDWTSSADLHKLRIRIKKLRYSSELLSPLFKPKDARKFLSRLTKMQDVLGRLNDAATAVHLAGQINPDTGKLENAEIIAYLKGYAHAQSHFLITAFEPAWKKFKTSKIFW